MKTALKTAMTASISEVLETMFYMALEFNDEDTLEAGVIKEAKKTIACRINFKGKFSGYFILFIPKELLIDMTESFMGLDKNEISDELSSGMIKETINMLAGSVLSNYDDKIVFRLSIPEIVDTAEAAESEKGQDEEEIVVVAETIEGCLALKAVIEA